MWYVQGITPARSRTTAIYCTHCVNTFLLSAMDQFCFEREAGYAPLKSGDAEASLGPPTHPIPQVLHQNRHQLHGPGSVDNPMDVGKLLAVWRETISYQKQMSDYNTTVFVVIEHDAKFDCQRLVSRIYPPYCIYGFVFISMIMISFWYIV